MIIILNDNYGYCLHEVSSSEETEQIPHVVWAAQSWRKKIDSVLHFGKKEAIMASFGNQRAKKWNQFDLFSLDRPSLLQPYPGTSITSFHAFHTFLTFYCLFPYIPVWPILHLSSPSFVISGTMPRESAAIIINNFLHLDLTELWGCICHPPQQTKVQGA